MIVLLVNSYIVRRGVDAFYGLVRIDLDVELNALQRIFGELLGIQSVSVPADSAI